jgi:hypothetical protein
VRKKPMQMCDHEFEEHVRNMKRTHEKKLAVGHTIEHCYPVEPGETQDMTMVELDQSSVGKDCAELSFTNGLTVGSLTFINAKELDRLSEFFAAAAQKLRYCTR